MWWLSVLRGVEEGTPRGWAVKIVTPEELEAAFWSIYRRGVIHGGLIAVAAAAVWLMFKESV